MKQILLFLFLVGFLNTLLIDGFKAFAQNEKNKSRLSLKKTQSAYLPKLPILLAKRNFRVNEKLETNLDMKFNNYISQFLKSSYELNSFPKSSENALDKKFQESENSDRHLFKSERIEVSNLYPNPALDYVDVDYQIYAPSLDVKIVFFNILGQEVKEWVLDPDQKNMRLSLKDLSSGMFIYQLVIEGRSQVSKKLIVRKN
jgi:hypothetical protein